MTEKVELLIKIPKKDYDKMCRGELVDTILVAIKEGVPLPKGHGDLIDRNELKKIYDERITYLYALNKKDNPSREARICATNWCTNTIDELPTIIKADAENEQELDIESILDL